MTRIPDYLMDSVIHQVSARDLSAGQQDQNRPRRLEQKRQLYLIKLKLDCLVMRLPRLPQDPSGQPDQNGSLNIREEFAVRPMGHISNLYNRDLPDMNDPKTTGDTANHQETKLPENSQMIRGDYDVGVESTGQGDPIGAAKEATIESDQWHSRLGRTNEVKEERMGQIKESAKVQKFGVVGVCSKAINGADEAGQCQKEGEDESWHSQGTGHGPRHTLRMGMMEEAQQQRTEEDSVN
ncbi:hypothetical protein PPACK8108_LOCUS42 [Phakopsora pachyrhizi]|uniref:Uncharacterized protein n=1 Tax=Phakopsora pachyrhizi TaxID=170000 RepID=A0AAV0ACQ0_PHAPC|nr:hypothetical protein PPACK8108_LOCUS42 [Phakopsora pachyrhizi]